jgi:hypothetical protein
MISQEAAGDPVVRLRDPFSPLWRWVSFRFGGGLALVTLHGRHAEHCQLSGDVVWGRRARV